MIVTTTPSIEGHTIEEYLGVVSGRGKNAGEALADLEFNADVLADAVVGVSIAASESGYNTWDSGKGDATVHVIGTAVTLTDEF